MEKKLLITTIIIGIILLITPNLVKAQGYVTTPTCTFITDTPTTGTTRTNDTIDVIAQFNLNVTNVTSYLTLSSDGAIQRGTLANTTAVGGNASIISYQYTNVPHGGPYTINAVGYFNNGTVYNVSALSATCTARTVTVNTFTGSTAPFQVIEQQKQEEQQITEQIQKENNNKLWTWIISIIVVIAIIYAIKNKKNNKRRK